MPRDGSNIFSPPAGTTATPGTPIESAKYNAFVSDLTALANEARPIVAGGTGATTAAAARTALGVQASSPALTSIAALATAADKGIYTTGANTYATFDLTAFARTLLDDGDAAAARTTLGAQQSNANLASLAGITLQAGDLLYATGANTLVNLAKGTARQVLQMNSGATAPEWGSSSWTLVETLDCTSGTTKETSTFEAGRDYKFVLAGISHADATTRSFQIEFFGETAAAYSAATPFTAGVAPANNQFGEYDYASPRLSRSTHVFKGQRLGNTSATGADSLGTLASSDGAYAYYAVSQGVSKVRFSVGNGAAFDNGAILIYKR